MIYKIVHVTADHATWYRCSTTPPVGPPVPQTADSAQSAAAPAIHSIITPHPITSQHIISHLITTINIRCSRLAVRANVSVSLICRQPSRCGRWIASSWKGAVPMPHAQARGQCWHSADSPAWDVLLVEQVIWWWCCDRVWWVWTAHERMVGTHHPPPHHPHPHPLCHLLLALVIRSPPPHMTAASRDHAAALRLLRVMRLMRLRLWLGWESGWFWRVWMRRGAGGNSRPVLWTMLGHAVGRV